ncbi:hypothetical protein F4775DRAFT_503690 [Biscogniauxia sp. FL1348]|nr:hypothetical protein F4775DRAFT_503690 [Biscogniauxia sp. FL1348]
MIRGISLENTRKNTTILLLLLLFGHIVPHVGISTCLLHSETINRQKHPAPAGQTRARHSHATPVWQLHPCWSIPPFSIIISGHEALDNLPFSDRRCLCLLWVLLTHLISLVLVKSEDGRGKEKPLRIHLALGCMP